MVAYSKQIDDVVAQTKWTSTSPSLIGGYYGNVGQQILTFQTGVDQWRYHHPEWPEQYDRIRLQVALTSLTAGTGTRRCLPALLVLCLLPAMQQALYQCSDLNELATGTYDVIIDYGLMASAAQVQLFRHGSSNRINDRPG